MQQGQNNKGMFANPQVLQVAFGDNVRTGNNSEILYPDAHTALVLHLEDYQATKPIPFAQLEEQIKSSLALAVSKKQAQTLADKVTKELNNSLTLSQITNKYGLCWITEKNRGRYENQQQVNSLILKAAFDLLLFFSPQQG